MTLEVTNECADNSSQSTTNDNAGDQGQNVHDLSSSMSTNDEVHTTPSSSQQSSPTKQPSTSSEPNTPSKSSKSRRKREAQKARKSNQKAMQNPQQQEQATNTNSNQMNSSEKSNSSMSKGEHQQQQQQNSTPTATSSSRNKDQKDSAKVVTIDSKEPNALLSSAGQISTQQSDTPKASQEATAPQKSTTNSTTNEQTEGNGCNTNISNSNKHGHDTNSWRRRQHDNYKREIHNLREHLKIRDAKLGDSIEKLKLQGGKIKELEATLMSTTKTCNQFEKLLQQELTIRSRLETENESLNQMVSRLKSQIVVHEKNKFESDELIRVLNATLMERETEISILKLKMTRMQTNPSSTMALNAAPGAVKQDPCQVYATAGRSNSEFCRNSYIRSSLIAEAASTRNSTNQLKSSDKDATVWAAVPEELTPSKRPLMLERHLQPLYSSSNYSPFDRISSPNVDYTSTPILRGRNYRTMPRSMKSPFATETNKENTENLYMQPTTSVDQQALDSTPCLVTNLDDSNSATHSNSGTRSADITKADDSSKPTQPILIQESNVRPTNSEDKASKHTSKESLPKGSSSNIIDASHYSTIGNVDPTTVKNAVDPPTDRYTPPSLPHRAPSTPIKLSGSLKKLFGKFKRSESSTNSNSHSKTDVSLTPSVTPASSPFKRGANRSTMANPTDVRSQLSPRRQASFQTDKPFAEWDTDMLVEWLTMIGLSMYTANCRRWVRCGAHIMNATPAEVDKGLGITNPIHRKKLRLAISELNGDSDKVTKAAAKLDYLWVARWLDDIGLPQHKEAFINARVDGRVLNYLTVEDLVSMNVKSLLHHASIKCGIKVLRSINFDLQLLRRRATAEEAEQMDSMRQQINQVSSTPNSLSLKQSMDSSSIDADVPLWTCHRVMEWLRMIDFAEFAPNLRGSGVHGGLMILEDGFNIDTMCSLLSIPSSRTLLRRHLSTFFEGLVGKELAQRKRQYKEASSNQQLNPSTEIKTPKKSPSWFPKLKSSKVAQDAAMDEYLCPMYPIDQILIKGQASHGRKGETPSFSREGSQLSRIPESINV